MKDVIAHDMNDAACSTGEELVAYLYGELRADEAAGVEGHLRACDRCTSEFADLSFARLDVFQWNKEEFSVMETPRITVPYGQPVTSLGWVAAVQSFFASPLRWAVPAAGFAAMAIAFGTWLGSPDIAGTEPFAVSVSQPTLSIPPDRVAVPREKPVTAEKAADPVKKENDPATRPKLKATKAVVTRSLAKPAAAVTAERRPVAKPAPKTNSVPRLNNFDDEDDTTLRLGDLLAEIDTRDE